ncbi:leucine-rich_repeat domain-containing protein [Hexamita inflata]|uniref:Leucine-rich repeat domain-containing protein n=1 Tax=Hexamita inflata TaxID=28002 RepID=A0AA86NQ93_9EUKA|nr:leucine-rich repeat domain-containing protein [Hexamita inflata]CAI9924886.1 leucine-rich repeat domain-containing protein [Hexamita inflata]
MLFVADFKNLHKLVLFNNNITDASSVSKLIHLEHLNLSNNSIVSFKPLESLKNISELHVNSNKIKCIMFLSVFQKLHTLYIVDNEIIDINQFAVLINSRALKYVHVDDNPVLNNPETKLRLQRFINEKFRDQMFKPFLPFNKCFTNIGAHYNQRHQIRIQLLRNKGVELKNALIMKQQIAINAFMFRKTALFLNCFKSFVGFE